MKSSLLFLFAILLHPSAGSPLEPRYVVVIPAILPHPQWQKICVHLSEVIEELQLTITLRTHAKNLTLAEKTIDGLLLFECIPFQVPAPSSGDDEVASVNVAIHGATFNYEKSKKVLLKRVPLKTFIQTDKEIYKPGETVKFRIITLDNNHIASNETYPLVELQDPDFNRVGQWLDVKPKQGIVDLSFPLAHEPPLGTYYIKAPPWEQVFKVREYVLPKFEVFLEVPEVISIAEKELHIKACGRYTYGKPVRGTMAVSVCRTGMTLTYSLQPDNAEMDCKEYSGETDRGGCFLQKVIPDTFNFTIQVDAQAFNIDASLKENSTGLTASSSARIPVSSELLRLEFENVESYYQTGMQFHGTIKVIDYNHAPVSNATVYLILNIDDVDETHEFVSDESGLVHFSLDTSSWNDTMVSLTGKARQKDSEKKIQEIMNVYFTAFRWLKPFYSESKSFLQIRAPEGPLDCHQDHPFMVTYLINRNELPAGADDLHFFYLVMSKSEIARSGEKRISIGTDDSLNSVFEIPLRISSDLAPTATMIIFTIFPDGEVAADNYKFKVSKCFKNKATVAFSNEKLRPGSDVTLHVQTAPGSLCSVRAVDKSVKLMSTDVDGISTEMIYRDVSDMELSPRGFPYRIEDFEPYPCLEGETAPDQDVHDPQTPPKEVPESEVPPETRAKRSKIWAPWYQSQADVYSLFKQSGLKILTNARIKKPVACLHPNYTKYSLTRGGANNAGVNVVTKKEEKELQQTVMEKPAKKAFGVRSYFPETWLYDLVPVGDTGKAEVHLTVPDTITEWQADAFCMADNGLGLAPSVGLTAFQPYFVDLELPYSVIRGEEFPLKATVFNYMKQCMQIRIVLDDSLEFRRPSSEEAERIHCICANDSVTFTWNILATKLGKVNFTVSTRGERKQAGCESPAIESHSKWRTDTMVKSVLVRARGVQEEKTTNSLLCPYDKHVEEEKIELALPELVVQGSARAIISILGDPMLSATENLGGLLQMPFGCGEQNIALFAPNIYILQYLQSSGQLTPELEEKALGFLRSGYQRQLVYKHEDGSYSAFGKTDEEGNTWLTAFVVKTFSQARRYVYIDEQNIKAAVNWLEKHQEPNGCFQSVGKLFNNAMKGSVDDDISLTAYSTGALLEAGLAKNESVVENALRCLKNHSEGLNSTYIQALLLYVYTLAEEPELRQEVLKKLEASAISEGGRLHWDADTPSDEYSYWGQATGPSVEIAAYTLLGLLTRQEVPKEDLQMASQIVSWVAKIQNPYGGFVSTQDTVVGLQALAKYSALTYSEKRDVTVTVKSEKGYLQEFYVNQKNRLVLQQASLPDIPGDYNVSAAGDGCVYVQTTLRYNIPPPRGNATFVLHVGTKPKECTEEAATQFDIQIEVSYVGNRKSSNMALIEVKMLSGFIPVKKTVRKLEKNKNVKKTEVTVDKVILYLDELTHESQSYTFSVEQETPIKNLKPATVNVIDYYKPEDCAVTDYKAPCSTDNVKEQYSKSIYH